MLLKRRDFANRDAIPWVFWILPRPFCDGLGRHCCKSGSSEDPGTVRQGMDGLDLARFRSQSKGLGHDLEQMRGLAEIEPWLVPIDFGRLVHRNAVMRPQGSDAFARPSIAVACDKAIPVEDAGDKVVIGDQHELPNGGNHIG